jgi:hypothetical protein
VAVGSRGIILTSPDGVNWTVRTSGTSDGAWPTGLFVAVGQTSSPPRTELDAERPLHGVTYVFVAVGPYGTILTSPDGVSWTRRTSGTSTTSTA